jgi:hypothetical protein
VRIKTRRQREAEGGMAPAYSSRLRMRISRQSPLSYRRSARSRDQRLRKRSSLVCQSTYRYLRRGGITMADTTMPAVSRVNETAYCLHTWRIRHLNCHLLPIFSIRLFLCSRRHSPRSVRRCIKPRQGCGRGGMFIMRIILCRLRRKG